MYRYYETKVNGMNIYLDLFSHSLGNNVYDTLIEIAPSVESDTWFSGKTLYVGGLDGAPFVRGLDALVAFYLNKEIQARNKEYIDNVLYEMLCALTGRES